MAADMSACFEETTVFLDDLGFDRDAMKRCVCSKDNLTAEIVTSYTPALLLPRVVVWTLDGSIGKESPHNGIMDSRYSQDGEHYTPPPGSSSSSARQSFNRFKDSVPGRVSSLRDQLQSLPDKFPQVAGTIQGIPDRLQSIPDRLQTLPEKFQTVQERAQEQFARLPDRLPNRPTSKSVSSPQPTSPVIAPLTASMMAKAPERNDPAYDPALAALAAKILYRSGSDPESGGPLLILCAASFPDANHVDYNKLLPYVLSVIPSDDELGPEEESGGYSVVFFSGGGGLPGTGNGGGGSGIAQGNRPSWAWTLQAYHLLGRAVRKRIRKLWVVHERAWVRIIFEMMAGVVSVKFRKKVVHLNSISDLAMHLDITNLLIPPAVYFHDRKLSPTINIPFPSPPVFGCSPFHNASNPPRVGENMPLPQALASITRHIRSKCLHVEGIFRVPPNATLLDILREAVDRGQYLKLEEWGPHTCAALIKLYYRSLPEPIFPAQYYEILMSFTPATSDAEDGDKFKEEFIFPKIKDLLEGEKGLPKPSRVLLLKNLLPLLALVAQNAEVNKMTPKNLAVCIAASLIGSGDMMADFKASSGVRKFLEVAIERIEELAPRLPDRPNVEHGRHSSVVYLGANPLTPTTSLPPYTPGKTIQRKKVPGTENREGGGGVSVPKKAVGGSSRSSMDGQTLVDSEGISSLLQPMLQPQPVVTPPPVVYRRGSTPSLSTTTAGATPPSPPPQTLDSSHQGGVVLRRKESLQALSGGGGEGTLSKGPSYPSPSNLSPHNISHPPSLTRSLSVSSPMPPHVVRRAVSSSFLPSTSSFSPSPSSNFAAIASSLNRAQSNPDQNIPSLSPGRDSINPTVVPMVRTKTEVLVGSRSRSGTLITLSGNESRRGSVAERKVPVVSSGVVEELRALYEERAKGVEVLVRAGARGSVKGRWKNINPNS